MRTNNKNEELRRLEQAQERRKDRYYYSIDLYDDNDKVDNYIERRRRDYNNEWYLYTIDEYD